MQGSEIKTIFTNVPLIKNHFKGIFSIDTLPKLLKKRTFLICNTAEHNKQGEHWFCICRTDSQIEVFDSLGINSNKRDLLLRFCKFKNTNGLIVNETQFQSSLTSTCGLFVIYFAIQRFHNLDMGFNTLLYEIFTKNLSNNEDIVKTFCTNLAL